MTDPNFERSLRAAARRGRTGGVHPDASLLAAYVDRGLSDVERAELEAHVADCAECMERLALLGSVNVPDEPEALSFEWSPRRLLSRWGWLVPVATVVLLVAVWQRQPARQSAPPVPPATTAPAPAPEAGAPEADQSAQKKEERPAQVAQAPARQEAPKAKDAAVKPRLHAEAREATPRFAAPADGGASADELALRDKKHLDALTPMPSNAIAAAPAAAPAAKPAPTLPSAQAESAAAASVAGRADEAKPGNRPQASAVAQQNEKVAEGVLLKSAISGPATLATGPGVAIRRLGSRLERSTDNGATWTLDLADAPAGLHVGTCPSATTCWVGGAEGVVMVRQPSGAWTRHVVADARAAVIAVDAADATTATVRLSDGRSFRTSDGGSTWVESHQDR